MNFAVLPPEVTSARLFAGAGSGSMLAAATAWDGLACELGAAAAEFGSVTSGIAGSSWQGPASAAMTAAAAPYVGWLNAAASQAAGTAGQARVAASLHEAALAAAVHPAMVAANRGQLVSLVTANFFGQNAPAIAATEAHYEQMWAQDIAAMVGYRTGASAMATQLTRWSSSLPRLPGLPGGAHTGSVNGAALTNIGSARLLAPALASAMYAPSAGASAAMAASAAILPVSIGNSIEALYLAVEPWVQYGFNLASYAVGWVPYIGILAPQINIFYYLGEPIVQALLFNTIDFLDGTISFSQALNNIYVSTAQSINQFINNEIYWVLGYLPPLPPI